ncbi:4'-phosphopantetheinyl transferase [Rhizodiscina lignyota]|uniref:holo-[acyl-carrier-protein] synthase n=1 Tax=Rhizodiscina lignyota TaxID=1504668 RepID=A0A9P4MAN7_9PEZI|nr:4'-phosphopantetheinyl transferase [Rhizodiscina lignyota]
MPMGDDITCWLLDTRSLWKGASEELRLVSPDERDSICRKMQLQDAKMSLASALLKRAFISKTFRVPWTSIRFGRKGDPIHGKPCYIFPNGSIASVDFNVSHQAGLVALVGTRKKSVEVGVDITCVNERNDYRHIDEEGFDGFVDIYEEVFSQAELWDIKYNIESVTLLDGTEVSAEELGRHDRICRRNRDVQVTLKNGRTEQISSELIIDAKLRRFYAFYAYKEAYIKLVGEGLLATWLKALEFKNVRAPKPGTVMRCSTYGTWGEKVDDAEAWLKGRRVDDVRLWIQGLEEDVLIATAVRGASGALPDFQRVDLNQDILRLARK